MRWGEVKDKSTVMQRQATTDLLTIIMSEGGPSASGDPVLSHDDVSGWGFRVGESRMAQQLIVQLRTTHNFIWVSLFISGIFAFNIFKLQLTRGNWNHRKWHCGWGTTGCQSILFFFLNEACPQEKLFYHSLTCWGFTRAQPNWGKGHTQHQSILNIPSNLRVAGVRLRSSSEVHRLIKGLRITGL